jgi:hypothetical protein
MAAKKQSKQRQPPQRLRTAALAAVPDPQDAAALRAECERLRAELLAARAEITDLRAKHENVLNRLDWVIDSLDTLSSDG